jgi:putative tryptophan/tyrosine transport system substrate-binding protein
MKRRVFIALLGGAVALPFAARAQQAAIPVIGFLDPRSPDVLTDRLRAFRQGLKDTGYVEGKNVAIEYRWAEGHNDRLPALAAELVRRQVAVIVTNGGPPPALAAKAATATIPIVFGVGDDPVRFGLVASLAHPGGNATGTNSFISELTAMGLGLLREPMPGVARVAVLVNPVDATTTESTLRDVEAAAHTIGLQIRILNASTSGEINAAFAAIVSERVDALFVSSNPFFLTRRVQIATLAARHAVPATYGLRDFAEAGGLMSYGTSLTDASRQQGIYVGRILKGENPSDLPVVQAAKFELVINLQTAKALGLEIPPTLLARADR